MVLAFLHVGVLELTKNRLAWWWRRALPRCKSLHDGQPAEGTTSHTRGAANKPLLSTAAATGKAQAHATGRTPGTSTAADGNSAALGKIIFCGNTAPPSMPRNLNTPAPKTIYTFGWFVPKSSGRIRRSLTCTCLWTNATNSHSRLPPAVGWGRQPLDNGMEQIGTSSRQIGRMAYARTRLAEPCHRRAFSFVILKDKTIVKFSIVFFQWLMKDGKFLSARSYGSTRPTAYVIRLAFLYLFCTLKDRTMPKISITRLRTRVKDRKLLRSRFP